jgi:hypothetical protein
MTFRLTDHAEREMLGRGISRDQVTNPLDHPEQIVDAPKGRKIYQSRVELSGKSFLIRVIVDPNVDPAIVITVYRTSKIAKYWRQP